MMEDNSMIRYYYTCMTLQGEDFSYFFVKIPIVFGYMYKIIEKNSKRLY